MKCDTHLLRHVVAQKLMLDENSGWVKLGRDAFVIPRTNSAAFLSQCTNIVWLLLTKKPQNDSIRRACWKHFSVLVLVEVVEFHLGLSLSSKISGFCPKRRWSFVEEHQVARSGVNYTSSPLISIFELLRKDRVFDNTASGRRLLKSPNESWYDFN